MRRALALPVTFVVVALWAACGGATTSDTFGTNGDGGSAADGSGAPTGEGGVVADGASVAVNTSCSNPGECVLGEPGCCGVGCGTPTLSSYVAIHRGENAALLASTCDSTQRQPVACPDCPVSSEAAFQAFCRQQKCVAIDVRKDVISACKADVECILRPSDCCPCGPVPVTHLVAIARVASDNYRKQVCDPAVACPKCAWEIPSTARARCNGARNHCEVDPN